MRGTYRGTLPRVHAGAFGDPGAPVIGEIAAGGGRPIWMTIVMRGDVQYRKDGQTP